MSTGIRDEPGSREPGLDQLIRALTADGQPRELAGRDAALAAFRAASGQPRRARFTLLPGAPSRLSAAAAALVAAFAGFTAAAYAKALPAPVQHIAYSVLAPFGVPDSQPAPGGHHGPKPGSASGPATAPGGGTPAPSVQPSSCPCPGSPSRTAARGSALAITAVRAQLPANGWEIFAGKLTYHGRPEPGVRVRLLEQAAGASGWRQAGSGVTGGHGGVWVGVPHVTRNAIFMLAGPNGVSSASISVTVIPRVLIWRAAAQPGTDRLVGAARFGDPGDLVTLQQLSGGSWQTVATQALGAGHRAPFDLPAAAFGGHYYRVALEATSAHGGGVSTRIWVPRARAGSAHVVQPPPTPPPPTGWPGPGRHHPVPRPPLPGPVLPGPVPPSPTPTPGPVLPGPVPPTPIIPTPVLPGPVNPGPVKPEPTRPPAH